MAQVTEVSIKVQGIEALTGFIEAMTVSLDETNSRLAAIESAVTSRPARKINLGGEGR